MRGKKRKKNDTKVPLRCFFFSVCCAQWSNMRSSCSSFHRLPLENQLERKSIVKQENSCFHWNPRNKKLPISDAGCSYIASHLVVVHWAGSRRARRKQIITLDLKRLNHLYQSQPEFSLIPYWNTLVSKWMRCLYTRQAIQFHCPPPTTFLC